MYIRSPKFIERKEAAFILRAPCDILGTLSFERVPDLYGLIRKIRMSEKR